MWENQDLGGAVSYIAGGYFNEDEHLYFCYTSENCDILKNWCFWCSAEAIKAPS